MKGKHNADSHMANICRLFPRGLRGWDWVVSRKFGRRLSFKGDLDTLNPFSGNKARWLYLAIARRSDSFRCGCWAAAILGRARFGHALEPDARRLRNQEPKSWCEESQERSQ